MSNSMALSDYDKETIKMLKESKLLIVDLDGTMIDFESIDKMIIAEIFPGNILIKFIDNILWKVNRLDVFGNGYAGLKLRLGFYAFLSRHSLDWCKEKYSYMYSKLAQDALLTQCGLSLSRLTFNDYRIMIVTKNVYAKDVISPDIFSINPTDKEKVELTVLKKDKKKVFKSLVEKYDGKVCVIGNNLSDDINSSKKIGVPFVYVGNSRIVKKIIRFTNKHHINRGIQVEKFGEIADILCDK